MALTSLNALVFAELVESVGRFSSDGGAKQLFGVSLNDAFDFRLISECRFHIRFELTYEQGTLQTPLAQEQLSDIRPSWL